MRLLHTTRLTFQEFFDEQTPVYAILSHRWGSVDDEVSYNEFLAGTKKSASGYAKILHFCSLASKRGYEYCWVDTCCIVSTNFSISVDGWNAVGDLVSIYILNIVPMNIGQVKQRRAH